MTNSIEKKQDGCGSAANEHEVSRDGLDGIDVALPGFLLGSECF
jgi:hypothetical protein